MSYNPFKLIFFIEKILTRIETFCLSSVLIFMLVVASIQVFLRKFFTAWGWADELNQMLVVWIGFLGAILAVKENRHLTTDVLTNFLSKDSKLKPIISLFVNLFVLVVTGVLTYVAWQFYNDRVAYELDAELIPGLPKAYFAIIFPVGFGLIFIHYFIRLIELFYNFAGGDKEYPQTSEDGDLEISIKIKMH